MNNEELARKLLLDNDILHHARGYGGVSMTRLTKAIEFIESLSDNEKRYAFVFKNKSSTAINRPYASDKHKFIGASRDGRKYWMALRSYEDKVLDACRDLLASIDAGRDASIDAFTLKKLLKSKEGS